MELQKQDQLQNNNTEERKSFLEVRKTQQAALLKNNFQQALCEKYIATLEEIHELDCIQKADLEKRLTGQEEVIKQILKQNKDLNLQLEYHLVADKFACIINA